MKRIGLTVLRHHIGPAGSVEAALVLHQICFLAELARSNGQGEFYLRARHTAAFLGCSERTVRRTVAWMRDELGVLRMTRSGERTRQATYYEFDYELWDKIDAEWAANCGLEDRSSSPTADLKTADAMNCGLEDRSSSPTADSETAVPQRSTGDNTVEQQALIGDLPADSGREINCCLKETLYERNKPASHAAGGIRPAPSQEQIAERFAAAWNSMADRLAKQHENPPRRAAAAALRTSHELGRAVRQHGVEAVCVELVDTVWRSPFLSGAAGRSRGHERWQVTAHWALRHSKQILRHDYGGAAEDQAAEEEAYVW